MQEKTADKPKVIAIVGPTASGKSAFAVRLAKAVGGEIISADSRQVYRGLNIGSGKVSKAEMGGIPHHLLDVANPRAVYSAARYKKDADRAVVQILKRGKVPIFCGGTGFYIALALGDMVAPEVPPNVKLRALLSKKRAPALYAQLLRLDPERAATIDRHNPVRLIRAIEIAKALGSVPKAKAESPYTVLRIGLTLPAQKLTSHIQKRLTTRMKMGMLAEAKGLHRSGLSWKRMEALGLEYRYLARHLQGKLPKAAMLEQLESEIHKYAKRQMTWFKRNPNIHWLSPKELPEAKKLAKEFLET